MKIVVLGYIVRGPLGGLVWHHFQYVLGLRKMGFDVLYLEDSDTFPGCYHPDTSEVNEDPSYGLRFLDKLFAAFSLEGNWAYFDAHTNGWYGRDKAQVAAFCGAAEIVLNISGVNPLREWWAKIPCRALLDTDPGFTQIRHLTNPSAAELAGTHTVFFSFAENIGRPGCTIPDDGLPWRTTRQPVFLSAWKVTLTPSTARWTTVMQWDSYQSREYGGRHYGMKSSSFDPFVRLPELLPGETFQLAMGSANAPAGKLRDYGWEVISSLVPTKTPRRYQAYISGSKGEWSVAKQGYVVSNSGWFSERSAVYLASGRPVITQETGFSDHLETGRGMFAFSSVAEALAAVEQVNRNYPESCRCAREVAEEFFDSQKVLSHLLRQVC